MINTDTDLIKLFPFDFTKREISKGSNCTLLTLTTFSPFCYNLNSKHYRDLYDEVVQSGEIPGRLPPDWLDVHNHLLALILRRESSLPENYSKSGSQETINDNNNKRRKRKKKQGILKLLNCLWTIIILNEISSSNRYVLIRDRKSK